jgi:hypothetical protein
MASNSRKPSASYRVAAIAGSSTRSGRIEFGARRQREGAQAPLLLGLVGKI